jgi:eukaryotic-like serine/threonine-protein kinase
MKNCPVCQKTNPEDATFCIDCGTSIAHAQGQRAGATIPEAPASDLLRGPEPASPASAILGSKTSGLLEAGALLDGKYRVERQLGEGGMGVVYVAADIHTQVPVVIKAIRKEYAHRQEFRERILAEGRALARIDHPNVVRLNAVVVERDALYLVMQFIEGESLDMRIQHYVDARSPMPVPEAIRIFRMVLAGVGAAHHEGVIHRDLKPANILMRQKDGVAKVTDFGIAKAEEDALAGRGKTRGIIGSLLYMAPEQLQGRRDLDKRVDIYALGILLFEMLAGHVPFDAPTEVEIMKLHLEAPVPRLAAMRPEVPAWIDELIHRACAKRREDRFATIEAFSDAVEEATSVAPAAAAAHVTIESGGGTSQTSAFAATNPASPQRQPTPEQRPRTGRAFWIGVVSAIAGIVALVAILIGVARTMGWGRHDTRHPRAVASAASSQSSQPRAPVSAPPSASAPAPASVNPLVVLAGAWKSDSGRLYDAVLSGDVLEMRIRDAKDLAAQGYIDGEARAALSVVKGETRTFSVEDKLRPSPPVGYSYDPRARGTCQEVWSAVDKKPLHAQFDGSRLTVDMVKITPTAEMFELQGKTVVGCKGLKGAPASRVESVFTRP